MIFLSYKRWSIKFIIDRPSLTELVGFEPTDAGVRVQCLTAWRQLINSISLYYSTLIFKKIQYLFINNIIICYFIRYTW